MAAIQIFTALGVADRSISAWLDKGDFTRADYQAFVKEYLPTMEGGFFLAILGEGTAKRGCLLKWKKELGADWEKVHVIIQGSEGRTTAGLTRDLHTSGVVLRTLMSEAQFNSHTFYHRVLARWFHRFANRGTLTVTPSIGYDVPFEFNSQIGNVNLNVDTETFEYGLRAVFRQPLFRALRLDAGAGGRHCRACR